MIRLTWLLLWVLFASAQLSSARQVHGSTNLTLINTSQLQNELVSKGFKYGSQSSDTLVEIDAREENCLTAYGFLTAHQVTKNSILPCTLIDELFFVGIGQKMSRGALEHGDQGIDDYYPIYRKYLGLKIDEGRSAFDAGSPGLILLGLASTSSIADLQKRALYEAYSLHQLSILHSKSIDKSGFSKDSVGDLIDGFFIEKLSSVGITTLGGLVCAVSFDVFDISLPDVLKTDAVQNCIHN